MPHQPRLSAFKPSRLSASPGFTLVELLIVMVVIGVLSAMLLSNLTGARQRARDTSRKFDLNQVKAALRIYYNDYQQYPDDAGGGRIRGCGSAGTSACSWGGPFTAGTGGGTTYMSALPLDPLNQGNYVYQYTFVNDNAFQIQTYLENPSDTDSAKSQLRCDPAVTSLTDPDIVDRLYLVCQD